MTDQQVRHLILRYVSIEINLLAGLLPMTNTNNCPKSPPTPIIYIFYAITTTIGDIDLAVLGQAPELNGRMEKIRPRL